MLHKEFFGLIFLGFVFWIIIATSPAQRIENACRPVGWSGNVITSMSALVLPNQQTVVQTWFDKIEYGCRYTTWRLFYQDDYNKWKASVAAQQAGTAPVADPVKPSAGEGVKPQDTSVTPAPVTAPASAPASGATAPASPGK